MLPTNVLQRFLLLFAIPTPAPQPAAESGDSDWSYDNTDAWGIASPTCDGYRQSPIDIRTSNVIYAPIPPIRFHNYDVPLMMPLTFSNNGHSANLDVTPTLNGNLPSISGGKMLDRYEAVGVHFHWGSPGNPGSEHTINDERYDMEMHIVHKNTRYATVDEATQHKDGLAVMAIMFTEEDNPDRFYPGLESLYDRLPDIIENGAETTIDNQLSLGELLGDLNTDRFYTYKGSLTTPPCSEAVTWHVFPDPLPISSDDLDKFFDLVDSHDEAMMDNYRPVQPLDGRKVVYRIGKPFYGGFPSFDTIPY